MTGRVCAAGGCRQIACRLKTIDDMVTDGSIDDDDKLDDIIRVSEEIGPIVEALWERIKDDND